MDGRRLPTNYEDIQFGPWHISYHQSHILASVCSTQDDCQQNDDGLLCQLCLYTKTLELPHLPDMVFSRNNLKLVHSSGGKFEFSPLDALKCVDNGKDPIQVACAEQWQETRSPLEEKVKPFDWTFSTDYMGTLADGLEAIETSNRIDIELLKKKDKILFYNDLTLFEDELHDHGIAVCSVKIRVMPTSWFILLRYFLRVDGVMLRLNDTRLFYEMGSSYVLREYTSREAKVNDLNCSPALLIEPSDAATVLPLTKQLLQKIELPSSS